jgi:hypothetical protein
VDKVEKIIDTALYTKPRNANYWSTRTLGTNVGTSLRKVHRIWSAHQIKPQLMRTFKLSKDPHLLSGKSDNMMLNFSSGPNLLLKFSKNWHLLV